MANISMFILEMRGRMRGKPALPASRPLAWEALAGQLDKQGKPIPGDLGTPSFTSFRLGIVRQTRGWVIYTRVSCWTRRHCWSRAS